MEQQLKKFKGGARTVQLGKLGREARYKQNGLKRRQVLSYLKIVNAQMCEPPLSDEFLDTMSREVMRTRCYRKD